MTQLLLTVALLWPQFMYRPWGHIELKPYVTEDKVIIHGPSLWLMPLGSVQVIAHGKPGKWHVVDLSFVCRSRSVTFQLASTIPVLRPKPR